MLLAERALGCATIAVPGAAAVATIVDRFLNSCHGHFEVVEQAVWSKDSWLEVRLEDAMIEAENPAHGA